MMTMGIYFAVEADLPDAYPCRVAVEMMKIVLVKVEAIPPQI